ARTVLADEDFRFGGRLNSETLEVDGKPGHEWAIDAVSELRSFPNVRLMPRTTVYGAYDHGVFGALERRTDHLKDSGGMPRQVLWRIYSKRAVVCAGATERPIAFPGNDRPGIMLAGAVRSYLNRFGVAAGKRVAVLSNNDDGLQTARDLAARGIDTVAVIEPAGHQGTAALPEGVRRIGAAILGTSGRKQLKSVRLADGSRLEVDCLAVSGGWNPNVQLTCHRRGRPVWKEGISAFVPGDELPPGMLVAGAANGSFSLPLCMSEGLAAGAEAAESTGHAPKPAEPPATSEDPFRISPFWHFSEGRGRAWVDHQNDVTVKDIDLSVREGMHSVEHLKRYTTLGMATDQG
ncbi:MAG: sarcosine oxidase subunit alpha, partial [Rhodospirillaceae bacterium]|nr:sarcosine oxidase subunit alpha [Rhodospirillaceae bacterium]